MSELIFISYSWKDSSIARALKYELEAIGVNTWIDYEMLNLKLPLAPQIKNALKNCSSMILLDSYNSRLSQWVHLEYYLAKKFSKRILTIQVLKPNKPFDDGRGDSPKFLLSTPRRARQL